LSLVGILLPGSEAIKILGVCPMINIRKRGKKNGVDLISRRKFLKFGGTVAIGAGRPKQILAYKRVTRGEVRP